MAHNKSLYQLPGFWLAIIIPLGLAAAAAGWIVVNGPEHDWCALLWSAKGINEVLGMMKLPLGVAALAFPCVALVTANHRSIQAVAQYKATESKNSFENNIKHREVFRALLEKEEARWGITFHDGDKLYEKIFSRNDYRRFEYYADDMKRNVIYYSYVDDSSEVAYESCFITPVINELTLYLKWFRKNRFHPHKTYKSLEVLFNVLEEFSLLIAVKDSELVPWERDTDTKGKDSLINWHPNVIHPYMNKMFEFLGNSFVEIIKFCYSSDFRENQSYLDQFLEFQHELSEAKEVFRGIVEQNQKE